MIFYKCEEHFINTVKHLIFINILFQDFGIFFIMDAATLSIKAFHIVVIPREGSEMGQRRQLSFFRFIHKDEQIEKVIN